MNQKEMIVTTTTTTTTTKSEIYIVKYHQRPLARSIC